MRMWPFATAKMERRESATDAIVAAIQSAAAGSGVPPLQQALASVEACAGLWSRAFASATVEPLTPATRALTPPVLAAIGRGLAVRGEVVFELAMNAGPVELIQAASWKVSAGVRAESWRYELDLPVSGGLVKRTLSADAVLHIRYATRPGAPWVGVSPLGMAEETRALAGWIERRLAEETSTATSYVLPLPESRGGSDALKDDIKRGAGRLHIVDTTSTGWGDGTAAAPRSDWGTKRLGADPPDSLGKLRDSVRGDVFGAYGIPNTVFGSGGAAREAYRQFLSSTITPIAKIALHELSDKLDTPSLAFDFSELRAADIAGRARAYGVLITAGMDPAEAAEATGLE